MVIYGKTTCHFQSYTLFLLTLFKLLVSEKRVRTREWTKNKKFEVGSDFQFSLSLSYIRKESTAGGELVETEKKFIFELFNQT